VFVFYILTLSVRRALASGRFFTLNLKSPTGRCRRTSSAVSPWSCFRSNTALDNIGNVNVVGCDSTAMTVACKTFFFNDNDNITTVWRERVECTTTVDG